MSLIIISYFCYCIFRSCVITNRFSVWLLWQATYPEIPPRLSSVRGGLVVIPATPSGRVHVTGSNETVRSSQYAANHSAATDAVIANGAALSSLPSSDVRLTAEDMEDPIAAMHRYAQQRNEMYRRAAQTFRGGGASYAGELAQRGRTLDRLMKLARLQVVRRCLASNPNSNVVAAHLPSRNTRFDDATGASGGAEAKSIRSIETLGNQLQISRQTNIDLHGLHVPEALSLLRSMIAKAKERVSSDRVTLNMITGIGHHSVRGKSRLRDAVRHFLESNNHLFSEPRDGEFRVQL